jgi:MFS transporter, DHA3 family, macrolide efflux protein
MEETTGTVGVAGGRRLPRWFSRFEGMGPFTLIWSGHTVTLVGTAVLRFAFVIRAWTSGGQATHVVLLSLSAMLPRMLLTPTAGALVDRLNRRTALQLADLGGFLAIGGLTAVYLAGDLRLWHIYVAVALAGCAEAFQYPALLSTVPRLVRKEQLQRANGLLATAKSTADVGGPALGGLLVAVSGLGPILWLDLASFLVALVTIRLVRIPAAAPDDGGGGGPKARRRLSADSVEGLRYLFARPSLRGLVLVFFTVNLTAVFGFAVMQPMILARTGDDSTALASVNVAIGIGGIAGGALVAAWGGPKNRVRGMMLGVIGMSIAAQVVMASVRTVPAWAVAVLVGAALIPVINSSMQSIVQTKVPKQLQGRVFGAVVFVSQIAAPVAMACSGPLADHVFEPQAAAGTGIAGLLAPLLGDGAGSGLAAMLLLAGVLSAVAALVGLASRAVRHIDTLIPDVDVQ